MVDVKISELPAITSVDTTDLLEVSEDTGGGTFASKKATAAQIRAGLAASGAVTSSGLTMTTARVLGRTTAGTGAVEELSSVPVSLGGTGQTSYVIGDVLYASTTTALSKLAGVATGNALISGGVGTAPSWGKVGLTTHVTGTLPLANGGTNATDAAGARTSLGLGTAATMTGPSGTIVGTTDTQTLSAKTIEAATFSNGYTEEVATANTGTAYTIDLANGSVQVLTLTGNCVFTFPTATAGRSFLLVLKQDGTGSRTATWPTSTNPVKWPSGTNPTITATANQWDLYAFTADGTNWLGRTIAQKYS